MNRISTKRKIIIIQAIRLPCTDACRNKAALKEYVFKKTKNA